MSNICHCSFCGKPNHNYTGCPYRKENVNPPCRSCNGTKQVWLNGPYGPYVARCNNC